MIEISAYLYMAKMRVLLSIAYRYEVIFSVLTNFIIVFATVFFWKMAYRGMDSVANVNLNQMITFTIVSMLLSTIYNFGVEGTITNRIREGDVAVDFMKPVNVFGMYFAQDMGDLLSALVQKTLPVLIFASVFILAPIPVSMVHFMLFLLTTTFSYLILWLLCAITGLASFWVVDLGPLGFVKNVIIRILSGSFVPIWFFPEAMQKILKYLPFIYTYQFPIGIYIGKTKTSEIGEPLLIQISWLITLFIIFILLQKRARNHLVVQGG